MHQIFDPRPLPLLQACTWQGHMRGDREGGHRNSYVEDAAGTETSVHAKCGQRCGSSVKGMAREGVGRHASFMHPGPALPFANVQGCPSAPPRTRAPESAWGAVRAVLTPPAVVALAESQVALAMA